MDEVIQNLESNLGFGVYKITSPIHITMGRRKIKKYPLNLNAYRNMHYNQSNSLKVAYTKLMLPVLKDLPLLDRVVFIYVIYPPTRREFDVANIGCIVDKFFSDTVVEANKLKDDNYKFLPSVSYMFGAVSKDNPRADIYIVDQNYIGKP